MDIKLETQFTYGYFPREQFSDSFNRPDATTLGVTSDGDIPWEISLGAGVTAATFGIESNMARIQTVTGSGFAAALVNTHHLDHQVSWTLGNTPSTGARWYIAGRNADNAVFARVGADGKLALTTVVGGASTNIITGLPVLANGGVLRARVTGSTLQVWIDGASVYSGDLVIPGDYTKAGFGAYQSASVGRVDQFTVTYP